MIAFSTLTRVLANEFAALGSAKPAASFKIWRAPTAPTAGMPESWQREDCKHETRLRLKLYPAMTAMRRGVRGADHHIYSHMNKLRPGHGVADESTTDIAVAATAAVTSAPTARFACHRHYCQKQGDS
jgi:hypothetical protein